MTAPITTNDVAGFSAVDDAPDVAMLVGALDEIAALPAVLRLRAAVREMLQLRAGDRIVDVGCGTGDEVRALAGSVGTDGSVVGVDSSAFMLDEARRRTGNRAAAIEYRVCDATALDLDDASVDGARCERVFQHLADPAVAMDELVRVTRPGGRIVVVDTDWGMHAIHGADPQLTARVLASWADSIPNGWSGRQLPARFAAAGIADPVVVAETFTSQDPRRPTMPPFPQFADAVVGAGALTRDEADGWLADLAEAARRGEFFWAATMFAVGGRRPG